MFSKRSGDQIQTSRKVIERRPPVPRKPITGIKEDSLSKKLRTLDNAEILRPATIIDQVYINTNEERARESLVHLRNIPRIASGCHIGFSGWHNFDIIAQRKSQRAVICDLNPENALFLHHILEILRECNDRQDFVCKATNYIKKNQYPLTSAPKAESIHFEINISEDILYSNVMKPHHEVALELEREFGWLGSEENFLYLQTLAKEDKIVLITENITAVETFSKIFNLLQVNGIQIDTVYTSNISHYLEQDKEQIGFVQTISKLLADRETILIDAPQNTQRITLSRDLKDTDLKHWFFDLENSYRRQLRTENPKPFKERVPRENPQNSLWCDFFKAAVIGAGSAAASLYIMYGLELQ